MKLYVGNLSFDTSDRDLEQLFSQVGTVDSAIIITDRDSGRSRGFGFVEMSSKSEGNTAIDDFNGKEVNGRSLVVNEAKQRDDRNNNSRSSYGGKYSGNKNNGGRTNRW